MEQVDNNEEEPSVVPPQEEQPPVDIPEPTEEQLHETVEQTIERAKKAQEAQNEPTDESQANDGDKGEGAAPPNGQEPAQKTAEHVEAPQRISPEARAWFQNADPQAQKEFTKIVSDLEYGQKNWIRQNQGVVNEANQVVHAIAPFTKDWALKNIKVGEGVARLCKTHEDMLDNPAKELARLVQANQVTLQEVQAYIDGTADDAKPATHSGMADISSHPEFKSLKEQNDYIMNKMREAEVKTETDRIVELQHEVDENGNKPYEHILNPAFLTYAKPLVNERRTPPRDENGQFTGAPKSIVEAYKELYNDWIGHVTSAFPTNNSTSQQPLEEQPHEKPAQPVSMRPRTAPANGALVNPSDDPSRYLHETVDQTVARLRSQNR